MISLNGLWRSFYEKLTEDAADSYVEEDRQDGAAAEHDEGGRLTGNITYPVESCIYYRFYFRGDT